MKDWVCASYSRVRIRYKRFVLTLQPPLQYDTLTYVILHGNTQVPPVLYTCSASQSTYGGSPKWSRAILVHQCRPCWDSGRHSHLDPPQLLIQRHSSSSEPSCAFQISLSRWAASLACPRSMAQRYTLPRVRRWSVRAFVAILRGASPTNPSRTEDRGAG